jgi:hypothetical protein
MQSDDDKPVLLIGEAELPRWVQVPVGILLALFALFCAFAAIDVVLLAGIKNSPSPGLAVAVVLILLAACFWVLVKCFRLVTGRKKRGGLLGPTALRVVAVFLLIIPLAALFTGYYVEGTAVFTTMGPLAIFQAVMYVFGFFGLRALARKREASLDGKAKIGRD